MQLQLSNTEAELILQLIERRLREIGPEISHTDSPNFRHGLEREEAGLSALQSRLSVAAQARAH